MPIRGILLDIEGTTSSIRFVYEQMFPFARRHMRAYLLAHAGDEPLHAICRRVLREADRNDQDLRLAEDAGRGIVESAVAQLMDQDAKTTGLKQLQGLVWKQGFRSGELRGHLYPDVAPCLKLCQERGIDVCIYSSGSVAAQRLYFEHSDNGNLLPWLSRHYDTTVGSKTDPESYRAIARDYSCDAAEITFVSDSLRELDAAREAGLATAICPRPGNPPTPDHDHPVYADLWELLAG